MAARTKTVSKADAALRHIRVCRWCKKRFWRWYCNQRMHSKCFREWRRRYYRDYQRRVRRELKQGWEDIAGNET